MIATASETATTPGRQQVARASTAPILLAVDLARGAEARAPCRALLAAAEHGLRTGGPTDHRRRNIGPTPPVAAIVAAAATCAGISRVRNWSQQLRRTAMTPTLQTPMPRQTSRGRGLGLRAGAHNSAAMQGMHAQRCGW
jgi:hypothetical protein